MTCTPSCCEDTPPQIPIRILLCAIGVLLAYFLLRVETIGLLGSIDVSDNLWVVFLLGVAASVSTCLAITGGVIMAYTDLTVDEHESKRSMFAHQLFLHGGRVLGFTVLGGVLGVIGQTAVNAVGLAPWLNGVVALVLLYIALQIIGVVPRWKGKGIGTGMQDKIAHRGKSPGVTAVFGALTFFVPCGFTQMIQVMALSSGSRMTGAWMLGIFALGTMPGLLALGVGTSLAKSSHKKYFEWMVAVVLIAFSLSSLQGTANLLTRGDSGASLDMSANQVETKWTNIIVAHDGFSLQPEKISLEAGKNYELTILPESDGVGCMFSIVLPRLDKEVHLIKKGEPIIYRLKNIQKGQYLFVCSSMGMEQGKLIVE